MAGCFGVDKTLLSNVILENLEHTNKFHGVKDTKISYTGAVEGVQDSFDHLERTSIRQVQLLVRPEL